MEIEHFLELQDKIKYKRNDCKIQMAYNHSWAGVNVNITIIVNDRVKGEPTPIKNNSILTYSYIKKSSEKELIDYIFNQIKNLELHEVYENFYVNDKRIYDPHI